MLIEGKDQVYCVDRDNTVFHIPNLVFPKRKDLTSHISGTLIDGVSVCMCLCVDFFGVCVCIDICA